VSKCREVRIRKDERKKERKKERLLASVMAVCSSMCMAELGFHWKDFFIKFDI